MSARRFVAVAAILTGLVAVVGFAVGFVATDDAFGEQPYGTCGHSTDTLAPGTGVNQVWTVPANTFWDIQSARAIYGASATAGSRTIGMQTEDATGNIMWRVTFTQAANTTTGYVATAGAGPNSANANVSSGLPPRTLQPGEKFTFTVAGAQAGDTWSQQTLSFCSGAGYLPPDVNIGNWPSTTVPQRVYVDNWPSTSLPMPVTIDGGIEIDGDIAVSPVCSVTTTSTLPDDDARVSTCVQRVKLDEAANLPVWIAMGFALVCAGVGFIYRMVRGA